MENTLRAPAWCAVVLLVLGQTLSWGGQHPVSEVWEAVFSQTSRPNPEWWIWFLAPAVAAVLAARNLVRRQKVSSGVLIPIGVFFITWVALFPLGSRVYLRFHIRLPGFVCTVVGLVLLGAVAAIGMRPQNVAPSRRLPNPHRH